jgi:hypothetical protein
MLLAMSAATVVAAASAAAAVGTFLAYVFSLHRSELRAARVEALALAETRGEIIIDLQAALESLERRHEDSKRDSERRILDLQHELARDHAEAREQAYRMHRFYATALTELLKDVRTDLEAVPPDVSGALGRIRELLPDDERPAA